MKTHKYGGIHGICIFVKNTNASKCTILTEFMSESVLWLHVSKSVLGYNFILGAVCLPHEESVYYSNDVFEFLTDDMTTIRARYDMPTILFGDFISRTGTTADFDHIYEQDDYFLIKIHIQSILRRMIFVHRMNKNKT